VGRRNTLIISGGEKVLPQEIEALLLGTGQVADVCVVGVPDRQWGQRVGALIVPTPEFRGIEALAALLRPHLAPYKQPKQWRIVSALPRTPAGKLQRTKALALMAESEEVMP
jgi:O-succinylbenzoic acid--CoA ligase